MAAKKIGMGLLGVSGIGVFAYTLKGGSSPSYAKATPEQIKQSTEMYKLLKDGPSHSLLKKHLTPEVFEKLKTRATENGGTLYNIIVSGAKNPEAHCGVYAPDAESYKVFGALFDPIIEEYHSFGPKEKQPACDLGEGKTEAFKALDKEGKYIQSTRIRCGRSIKGIPLNPLMKKEHYEEMEKKIKGAVDSFKADELKGKYYPLLGMSKDVQTQLIKDHFLFKDNDRHLETVDAFHYWPVGRGIFHNKDKTFLMWVGEEDHIRIISMESGGDIGKVLNRLNKGIREIETKVPFSRDERLGWITFCPTNLGSTVRASVHIRLPKVSARKDFEKMCDGMQLQVRGIHGEGSKSEVAVVFEAVKEMYDGIKTLIEMEERGGS